MQFKQIQSDSVQFKFDDSKPGYFSGYASMFNGVDSYGDTIMPGAYKRTLKKRDRPIRMRWNHFGPVIGKFLMIDEDEKGLFVEGELTPGHSVSQNVYASMKHGAVDGMSIGYRPVKIEDRGDGKRILKEIELIEISIVEEPADLGAKIGEVKHRNDLINMIESLKDFETFLRDTGGYSRANATALVSRIKLISLGDQEKRVKLADMIQSIKL